MVTPQYAQSYPQQQDDQRLLHNYLCEYSARGWIVVSQTYNSAQLKKPRKWSKTGLILGFVLLLLFGTGLIILLLTLIDYLIQSEKTIYFTADDIRAGKVKLPGPTTEWSPLLVLGIILALLLFGCFVIFALGSL